MATKKLATYELRINPTKDSFVSAIALVEDPAIESDFLTFSKEHVEFEFSANDEKQELLGAAMIPDMKIFRRDDDGTEFNVFFSVETIREIAQVFFKRNFQQNLNLNNLLIFSFLNLKNIAIFSVTVKLSLLKILMIFNRF